MPIAKIQLPDGRVARLEVPEGTTPQQAEAFVFEQMNASQKPAKAGPQDFSQPEAPTKLERFGRGMADVAQGLKQGGLMVKDLVTGSNEADLYTREKTDENALYEKGRKQGATKLSDLVTGKEADPGIDWMRIGGNVAATAPAMLIPGGGSAALGTRVASGAAQGAAASASMFTPEGQSKAEQIGIGALVGGAVPIAVQGLKRAGGSILDKIRPAAPASSQQLTGELTVKLQQQGMDWNKLTQEAQKRLLADAQEALSTGGTLDDAMLANKATIEAIPGVRATKAAITRLPRDWQTEKNLRPIAGVGDEIVRTDQSNAKAMTEYLQQLRAGTGGKAATPIEAGESAVNALQVADKAKARAVGELYDAFRDSGLKDAMVPETKLTESLTKIIDEVGLDNVPAAVQKRLQDFGFLGGTRTRYLTVQEADTFNRLLNANNPGHGAASNAIGKLKGALNESLIETPGGGELLTKAREAAASRFRDAEASKGVTAALDGVSPDTFMQKFVLNVPIKDFRATMGELGKTPLGKQAVNDMKGTIIDGLMMKATNSTSLDDLAFKAANNNLAFSGKVFAKNLDAIPPEKLHQIFTPVEVESLRALQKASKLLTEEVPFSDVNYSKTAGALANLLQKVGNTPMLNKVLSPILGTVELGANWVKTDEGRRQVAEALIASAARKGAGKAVPVLPAERFAPAPAAVIQQGVERQGNSQSPSQ